MLRRSIMCVLLLALLPMPASAADASMVAGGDRYQSGMNVSVDEPLPRDGFLSGFSVSTKAKVEKDINALGAYVDIAAPVGADVYAAAMTVSVSSEIGEDLTAAGANIQIDKPAIIHGNARLTGANIAVDGTVDGAVVAAGGHLEINGTIEGDARLTAGDLKFGPSARIAGTLFYSAPAQLAIPESVVPAARVQFARLESATVVQKIDEAAKGYEKHFEVSRGGKLFGMISAVVFLILVGAGLLWLMPARAAALAEEAIESPVKAVLAGMVGFAAIIGLVPVSGMTIVAIPLIPLLLLFAIVAWLGGYLLGVYSVAIRIAHAFGWEGQTFLGQLAILSIGLVVFALLNFIPILGWLVNLLAVFLGLGVVAFRMAGPMLRRTGPPLTHDAPPPATA